MTSWQQADQWEVGRYVIMPDHIHLFCSPRQTEHAPIRRWVQYWKSVASRSWPRPEEHPIWQAVGWDTQLRQGDSYSAKWEYVRNNPVRHSLVKNCDDWPYQGEIATLFWQD